MVSSSSVSGGVGPGVSNMPSGLKSSSSVEISPSGELARARDSR